MGIIIINQGWTDNLGDVAIGKTLKKELKGFHPIELQFAPIVAKPAQTAAFLSPNREIALSTRFCRFRKHTIFPKVLIEFRIRLVRENACINPCIFRFLSTHNVFIVVASKPVRNIFTTIRI